MNPEKVKKVWDVIKTIVEVILAALGGIATASVANATGLTTYLVSL